MELKCLASLVMSFLTLGCEQRDDTYDIDAIRMYEVANDCRGSLTIVYDTRLETMYESPGIRHRRARNELVVEIVRCPVRSQCKVDATSTNVGMRDSVTLPAMVGVSKVTLNGKTGTSSFEVATGSCDSPAPTATSNPERGL